MMHCHHDDLVLDERDARLMDAYLRWVDVARQTYGPEWSPSPVDVAKSRLFWWLRSGHDPLPSPPPCAYSCPWYEVVVEDGDHHVYELFRSERDPGRVYVAQTGYRLVEEVSETEMILAFGPYRFRVVRDFPRHVDVLVAMNGNRPEIRERVVSIFGKDGGDPTKGWFISRDRTLEDSSLAGLHPAGTSRGEGE